MNLQLEIMLGVLQQELLVAQFWELAVRLREQC
jgi:hypothetical protein